MSIPQINHYDRTADYQRECMFYTRTVAPTSEPLTLDEATRHLQLGCTDDSGYIAGLIQVARDVAEGATGRALVTSTWLGVCEDWPSDGRLQLAVAPVTAISSVKYYADGETTLTTVSGGNYILSTAVSPAVLSFDEDFDFPALANRPDAVQVTFVAGSATAASVPPSLKHALRVLVRHYYDNPGAVAGGGNTEELPMGLRHLLESNRVCGWVA